jgi:hypothetical protein
VSGRHAGEARRRLLLVELNEFNPELIRQAAAQIPLPNLMRVLEMRHSQTTTEDEQEHQGLDPWVQWVGVHTGQATSKHGVRRLGRTRGQSHPPLWEIAGNAGLSWGVWGAMNGPRGIAPGCSFFMPDPWSYEEAASSRELNDLLALPRYGAKNYLAIDKGEAAKAALRLARFFLPPARWPLALSVAYRLGRGVAAAGANVHTLATLFDYISVREFVRLRREAQPEFSLIFLNVIAHLQHQFWAPGGALHPNMALGLHLADEMVGLLLASRRPGEAIMVANGMRQKNVAGEGHFVYRQKEPQKAVEALGVRNGRVEQCMTNEAHIIFERETDANEAQKILSDCRLSDGRDVFLVERETPLKLFCQLALEQEVEKQARVISPAAAILFEDLFELVCERTGAHEQRGDIFSDLAEAPAELPNHKIFDLVIRHLQLSGAEAPMQAAA